MSILTLRSLKTFVARLRSLSVPALVPALVAFAFWPVLTWWVARTTDSSDAALGVVALGLVAIVCWSERGRRAAGADGEVVRHARIGWLELALIATYAVSFPFVPNLVRALFAAATIGVVVGRVRGVGPVHLGTWGLVAMTLPVLASLRFFLGYPLRWITTQLTAMLLRFGGLIVETQGLALVMGPVEVWVDGPCSGVKMLWVGVFLAAALAFIFRLKNRATVALFLAAIFATVAGNVSRAASVFYLESGILQAPDAAHDLAGMAAFAIVAGLVSALGFKLHRYGVDTSGSARRSRLPGRIIVIAVVSAAAFVPVVTPPSNAAVSATFEGWPATLDGVALEPRELSERDRPYLAGFPGRIAAFRAGDEDVLLRWVAKPTRRLHSAADCYRGLGWEVEPMTATDGWARFSVTYEGRTLIVRERLTDADGEHFSEVGAWYWAAMLGSSDGPWLNVVRVGTR